MVVEIDNLTRDVSKWIQNETTLKIPNGLVIKGEVRRKDFIGSKFLSDPN